MELAFVSSVCIIRIFLSVFRDIAISVLYNTDKNISSKSADAGRFIW